MIKHSYLLALATIPAMLAPSHVSAQTANSILPRVEFSGTSASFNIQVKIDTTQSVTIGPIVSPGFVNINPLDLNLGNQPETGNPIGQSTIDATVGKIGISSKTLFGVASGGSRDFDRLNFPSSSPNANTGLTVGGDDPILTIP
jgi:hypothetical protein